MAEVLLWSIGRPVYSPGVLCSSHQILNASIWTWETGTGWDSCRCMRPSLPKSLPARAAGGGLGCSFEDFQGSGCSFRGPPEGLQHAPEVTMDLCQFMAGSMVRGEHTLCLAFCLDPDDGELNMAGVSLTPLSQTHHYLAGLVSWRRNASVGWRGIYWSSPRRLMDMDGFLNWLVILSRSRPPCGKGRWGGWRTRLPLDIRDQMWEPIMILGSPKSLEWCRSHGNGRGIFKGSLWSFAINFTGKFYHISLECFHLGIWYRARNCQHVHPLWSYRTNFQLVQLEDVDRILGTLRPTICMLNPCPS